MSEIILFNSTEFPGCVLNRWGCVMKKGFIAEPELRGMVRREARLAGWRLVNMGGDSGYQYLPPLQLA